MAVVSNIKTLSTGEGRRAALCGRDNDTASTVARNDSPPPRVKQGSAALPLPRALVELATHLVLRRNDKCQAADEVAGGDWLLQVREVAMVFHRAAQELNILNFALFRRLDKQSPGSIG